MKITTAEKFDGFGSQFQNRLFCLLYSQLKGYKFVYNPINTIEHNIWNESDFVEKAESTINLKDYYQGNLEECDVLDDFYPEVEQNLDKLDFSKIKELYWQNKEKDFFKNGRFNIAVHIRRSNTRDCRIEGCNTPNDYYLYLINRLRDIYKDKSPLFHIYSQGNVSDFKEFEALDVEFHIEKDIFDTFNALVAADVLITSASSFSYVAALLSDNEVYYHLFWHKPLKHWKVLFDFDKLRQEKLKVPLLLCTMKFALSCDYIIDQRFDNTHEITKLPVIDEFYLCKLKDGDKLFIGGTNIELFVDQIITILKKNNIKLTILIGNIEPECNQEAIYKLLPYSYNIYVSNNVLSHEKIHPLPIGLRDPLEVHKVHKHFSHNIIRDKMKENFEKDYLCLMSFRLDYTSSQNRQDCYNTFKDKDFINNIVNKDFGRENPIAQCGTIPIDICYEYIAKSKYVLCAQGYGMDIHQFYEAIYLKTIPVVMRTNTPFDKVYEEFPCLILSNWQELTKELLENSYNCLYNQILSIESDRVLKLMN